MHREPDNPAEALPAVLVVDDEPDVLALVEAALGPVNCRVLTASSGREGLERLAEREDVELVISDMRMPEMDGIDFLKAAREQAPQTTRILFTGWPQLEVALPALEKGIISRLVSKPWQPAKLATTVGALLAERRRERGQRDGANT
jgi:DNA-binding NtrC family response regulator